MSSARLSAVLILAAVAAQQGHTEEHRMATGERTHCLGRYLIDLPSDARVNAKFVFADADATTIKGVDVKGFHEQVDGREKHLRQAAHRQHESLFVGRDKFDDNHVALASWPGAHSTRVIHYDMFGYQPTRSVLYHLTGQGNATDRARSLASRYQKDLLTQSLRFRDPAEVPVEPGFCIDTGFIARSKLNSEKVTADVRLNEYPSVTITFMSYVTGKPDAELLTRASSIPPGYEEIAARMKTLRRSQLDLGMAKGQELLIRGDGDGKTSYEFLWESQGRANSLEFPFLSLQLSTTAKSDADGEIINAPFESDEQAIAVWEMLLGTLRLRPGAVGR
ncbi:T6SS immunity protein Tli4 family protein [Luteimonas sp. A537]